ncbi:sulfite exporter TauE/SafE family protein [Palleronia sp. LCG004]|uniref:sulfite exporter TauE/SafE family protein n=1 Tax=Palleronia sp. LCG004 TaxID=3079304 RepID=UPI002942A641|nr:sulfite exporter TauE/SafE family protein [Palleronia sp. LCG004]WOI54854.1 sulfite exporter TauE/SafE family protein [Palleronia sp. LCG004]
MEFLALAAITVLAAGVYGFAGFGAALIAVPLFAQIVGPAAAIGLLAVAAVGSVPTVLPGAIRRADRRACLWMLGTSFLGLPLGVALLSVVDPVAIRWIMSLVVLGTLAALLAGLRVEWAPGRGTWGSVGGLVGLFGGATGLNGPPLVLFQLAGPDGAERSRANTITVLTLSSMALAPLLFWSGSIGRETILTGLALIPVYAISAWIGQRLFTPARTGLYRAAAFVIIGAAGVAGLPLWD